MGKTLLLTIFLIIVLAILIKEIKEDCKVIRRWKEDQKNYDWWEEKKWRGLF